MSTLKILPPRVPLTDPRTGLIAREWYLFFQGMFERVGGATGPSTSDVDASLFEDAGTSETNAALFALSDATDQLPVVEQRQLDDPLVAEVSDLREQVAALMQEIEALKQSVLL